MKIVSMVDRYVHINRAINRARIQRGFGVLVLGFLVILVWIPLKITKLPRQHLMFGHH